MIKFDSISLIDNDFCLYESVKISLEIYFNEYKKPISIP
jgi:hypothetical protein